MPLLIGYALMKNDITQLISIAFKVKPYAACYRGEKQQETDQNGQRFFIFMPFASMKMKSGTKTAPQGRLV